MENQDVERKLSAPKGEIEKAASAHRPSFLKGANEKPAMQFDAESLLQALLKPWEIGGHAHDFLVCHRSARTTDPYQHYEQDKVLLKRHERLVAEKEAWNRQRSLRKDMLHLLTRLHSVEKQRRQFTEMRRQNHPEDFEDIPENFKEEHADIRLGAVNLANTFFQKRPSQLTLLQPTAQVKIRDDEPPTAPASLGYAEKVLMPVPTPRTVFARQQVQELDLFDEKLAQTQPLSGGSESFPKKKK